MLSCKETARLVSDGLDRRLSLWQRMNLRLHLMMCGACSAYRRQVAQLNDDSLRKAASRRHPRPRLGPVVPSKPSSA